MSTGVIHIAGTSATSAARAGGSSFYFAMRILPREQREAMFEVYSFCKIVDDIADCEAPREWRLKYLAEWRRKIDAIYGGRTPVGLQALEGTIARFGLRREDFLAVIDGVEMDALEDICAPELTKLHAYCDRVACAVGRLSVRIFGMHDHNGVLLAHYLGRALQLTNILRDIDEDAAAGRLYLPLEALRLAGIERDCPIAVVMDPAIGEACNFLAELAQAHFLKSDEILARFPRRMGRAPRIMQEAYRRMLDDMIQRGWSWPRQPVHLSRAHLLRIALQHAFI